MSPVKALKDTGEIASPWAVIVLALYMIGTGQFGGGLGGALAADDIAKVASASSAAVQQAPNGAVVSLQFEHIGQALSGLTESLARIESKIDPTAQASESNSRRLDSIEQWIARQEKP